MWPFKRRLVASSAPVEPVATAKRGVSLSALAQLGGRDTPRFQLTPLNESPRVTAPFTPAKPMLGMDDASEMAFDDSATSMFAALNAAAANFGEGIGFMGYGYLAELAQRPEYRRGCEVLAREMTRRWIKFTYTGEEDDQEPEGEAAGPNNEVKPGDPDEEAQADLPAPHLPPELQPVVGPDGEPLAADPSLGDPPGIGHNNPPEKPKVNLNDQKLKDIEAEFKRLRVRDVFRRAAELDGVFGRAHVYLDTGDTDRPNELKTPLTVGKAKIKRKGLKRLVVVEPTWSYPQDYDSRDPLKETFYEPQSWLVNQKKVHASRLLTFVGREVPDLLKPAYSFGGLSLIQMAKPYVDNWLRTRQSVSDLLHSFTVWGIKTDLASLLNGSDDADPVIRRAQAFNQVRDNRGMMMVDKETEDFFNVSVPLGTLDHLQAQAQEQMASVFAIPLVVLLGITPSGLNASSDGEIRVFYDFIHAFQEHLFGHALERLLKIVQLSLFGEVDDDIGIEFLPLWQPTETDQATIAKTEADIDTGYITAGVLDPTEVRRKLASDKDSPYANIDPEEAPEDPNALPPGMNPITGEVDPDAAEAGDDPEGEADFPPSSGGAGRAPSIPNGKAGGEPVPPKPAPAGGRAKPPRQQGQDAAPDWKEGDHPRDKSGKFGAGGSKEYPLADREKEGWYSHSDYATTGGRMAEMSPEEYLSSVRPLDLDDTSRENIDDLKEHIKSGRTLDPLAIYPDGKEDGRHRAHAARELGIKSVPVLLWDRAHLGQDAEFNEKDHPRGQPGNAGQFGPGGGGGSKPTAAKSPSGAAKGFGTSNLEKGSKVGFSTKTAGELSGTIVELGDKFARVKADDGNTYRVPFDQITAGEVAKSGKGKGKSETGGERGEHFIPADKFNAAEYGKTTDDPDVTVESVLSHFPPDTATKIADAIARLRTVEQTHEMFKKDGAYSPERAALHRQILYEGVTKKVMNPKAGELEDKFFPGIISPERIKAATPAPGERPTFTILGGRGGSGKSKLEGVAYDPSKALVLNSDDIKERLPEYEGWNAGQVHEESDELMQIVDAFAKTMGLNIVHDVTMKTPEKALKTVQNYKDRGYRIEAHYMHVPRQEAAKRAIGRFLGKSNRLVSPEIILSNTRNEEAFELVKPLADKWSFRDNTEGGGPNTPAKLISEGGNG